MTGSAMTGSAILRGFVRFALIGFILAPLIVAVGSSFNGGSVPEFPPTNPSLKWYAHLFSQTVFIEAARNSLMLAVLATAINLPIALAAAYAIVRGRFPGREAIQTFLMSPLIVPAVVTGIAILLAFSQMGWRHTFSRLLLAHIVITLPYLIRTVVASLSRVDASCEEAARTLGATPMKTFMLVTLPQLLPGVLAGAVFAFIISFDNVSVSLFLTSAKQNTLPIAILAYVEYNLDPSIAAVSSVLIAATLILTLVIERVAGLRRTLGH
jgi:putative spermidine/putrescine transport system permease protein